MNGQRHTDFDALGLTVHLPSGSPEPHPMQLRPAWSGNPLMEDAGEDSIKVRVRLVPVTGAFDIDVDVDEGMTILTLSGVIDDGAEPSMRVKMDQVVAARPSILVVRVEDLTSLSKGPARSLAFARAKMDLDDKIFIVGANAAIEAAIRATGLWEECTALDTFDMALITG